MLITTSKPEILNLLKVVLLTLANIPIVLSFVTTLLGIPVLIKLAPCPSLPSGIMSIPETILNRCHGLINDLHVSLIIILFLLAAVTYIYALRGKRWTLSANLVVVLLFITWSFLGFFSQTV